MDINSYEMLKVVETMREYEAPLSVISVATVFPENKIKTTVARTISASAGYRYI